MSLLSGPTMPSAVAVRVVDELLYARSWTCKLSGSDTFSVETYAQIREERKAGGERAIEKWVDERMRLAFARAIEPKLTTIEEERDGVMHRGASVWVFTETEIRQLVTQAYLNGVGEKRAELLALLKEVSEVDPVCEGMTGDCSCIYCHEVILPSTQHNKDCLHLRVKAAVA